MATAYQDIRPASRIRTDSPERWQKAFERAMAANLAYIELIGGDGAWAVSSSSDPERGYIATTDTCTCAAGRGGDPCCLHRALVRVLTGTMPVDPAPELVVVPCQECGGRGHVEIYFGGGLNDYATEDCGRCAGTGINPTIAQIMARDQAVRASIRTNA